MRKRVCSGVTILALMAAGLTATADTTNRPHAIEAGKSVMTVRVYKAGVLSALGHDHEITAPIARGLVDTTTGKVELHIAAGLLRVRGSEASEKDRAEIQSTMLSPAVLDVTRSTDLAWANPHGGAESAENQRALRGEFTLPSDGFRHETRQCCRRRHTGEGRSPYRVRHSVGALTRSAPGGGETCHDQIRRKKDRRNACMCHSD